MSLEIGINLGWNLGPDSKITEKGGFNLHFIKGEAAKSALDFMDEDFEEGESSSILFFPPNMKEYNSEELRSSIDLMRDIMTDFFRFRALFALYFTADEIKGMYSPAIIMEGLNITAENESTMVVQESVITKMFANLGNKVAAIINEHKLWEKEAFRIKLLRQSPKKAFPRFTYKPKFGDWVELMVVPKEQSKVAFTKYEIGKGYDDPTIKADVVEPEEDTAFDETATMGSEDTVPELPNEEVDFN